MALRVYSLNAVEEHLKPAVFTEAAACYQHEHRREQKEGLIRERTQWINDRVELLRRVPLEHRASKLLVKVDAASAGSSQ